MLRKELYSGKLRGGVSLGLLVVRGWSRAALSSTEGMACSSGSAIVCNEDEEEAW